MKCCEIEMWSLNISEPLFSLCLLKISNVTRNVCLKLNLLHLQFSHRDLLKIFYGLQGREQGYRGINRLRVSIFITINVNVLRRCVYEGASAYQLRRSWIASVDLMEYPCNTEAAMTWLLQAGKDAVPRGRARGRAQ